MNKKREKQLREHWQSAPPEAHGKILEVFAKSAPKEELEFLLGLSSGKLDTVSTSPVTEKSTGQIEPKKKEKKK